jgi:hypothetical protein
MKQIVGITILSLSLFGCASPTRTLPVLVWEDRPISELIGPKRDSLAVPLDHKNPKLPVPKNDPVIAEYNKNNFLGAVKSTPLPPPRPYTTCDKKSCK